MEIIAERRAVVYIAVARGDYKIGHSIDPETRVRTARQSHIHMRFRRGEYPTIVHTIEAPIAHRVERALHFLFRRKQVYGEWFRLEDSDLDWIKAQTAQSILADADREWFRIKALPRGQQFKERLNETWIPESEPAHE